MRIFVDSSVILAFLVGQDELLTRSLRMLKTRLSLAMLMP